MKDAIKQMLKTIEAEARYTASRTGRPSFAQKVMKAMAEVERAEFVPDYSRTYAYNNGPLYIGFGQTISQPYIVALTTDLLEVEPDHIVLEVGTGSGYQAAVLAKLVKQIFTIERVKELADAATLRLQTLGYHNIETRCGNGYEGWPEQAPFDRIVVTAAAPAIPPALLEQLKPKGRLVIPVGQPYMYQQLMVVTKDNENNIDTEPVLSVAFVPLIDDTDENSENETAL
ncbi:protein-L-isoaspartate(D-aspartate) O-methyltransferase [Methylophaga sp. OBS4]|uniref:protein-L-isoaspartate(D-aspartate) O-methyltransferase n=1 Tax=Methylophaga sp. OBS4 TaxID=2991935 RepID=UPI00224F2C1B|nr:protein-L-isoaspartate(D-aspartate) O-methyltransferase [Methylophaga sp. OBS4]MCX4186937.1 protein-L-isoaspartate(D-aspartate) O-methyltransferase [Methylophaga sp. OBS4]